MAYSILVLNTGSTSTKLAVYQDQNRVLQREYTHTKEELQKYPFMEDQLPMRRKLAEQFIEAKAKSYMPFDAIVARGGILCPIHSGGYEINDAMVDYLLHVCKEEHASNVAACIAKDLAQTYHIPKAYIYDGISTDELTPIARISGIPQMPRVSITHALNMRAIAHKAAKEIGKSYQEANMVVVHMGGGISMSLHKGGKAVDVVGDDEGPFSPERCGGQQVIQFMRFLHGEDNLKKKLRVIRGDSGLTGYLGTSDCREVEERIQKGDQKAKVVYDAMIYQIAKYIGCLAAAACGEIDLIALTGGMAYSDYLVENLKKYISFLGPCLVYPGENEMESLAFGAYRILSGEDKALKFEFNNKSI